MERLQALRLISELFAEKVVGVDSSGDAVGQPLNAHFLACARAVMPDFPREGDLKPWVTDPAKLSDHDRREREKLSRFFQDLALGLTAAPAITQAPAVDDGMPF